MGTDGGESTFRLHFFECSPISSLLDRDFTGLESRIREEQKALLWLHMDAGSQRALKTIYNANLTLTLLARGAYQRGVGLFELFCDPAALGEETAEVNTTYHKAVRALLRTLWRNRSFLKIEVEIRLKEQIDALKEAAQGAQPDGQTPIIPSQIYCAILANLIGGLDVIERELPQLLNSYREEREFTRSLPKELADHQVNHRRNQGLEALRLAMRERGWTCGTLREYVTGAITRIQLRLMNVVIAFTGMRIGEARILPLQGVLETVESRGSLHLVIHGFSHKLNGGKKVPASWVTNAEGARAVELAKTIASTLCDVLRDDDSANGKTAFLFPSMLNPYKKQATSSAFIQMRTLIPELCPLVSQHDIDELNAMELERDWMRESIVVGQPWPLTFHQFRRSLSVYAHRSGMVSLPAMKGQLQHITDEMRAYYSDGFCRAVNLVFDKDHFSHEWRSAKAESSFLAYSLAILFSDDDLIGEVGGKGAERMNAVVSTRSKAETLKLFRDGKLAYRENVLGGCTAVDGCDQPPLEPIPWECLEKNCTNAVVFTKRLQHLAQTQEQVVATLSQREPGGVEHRLEAAHLAVLLQARRRLETRS